MCHDQPQPARYKVDALLHPKPAAIAPESGFSHPLIRLNASAIADAKIGVIESGSMILKELDTGYEIVSIGTHAQIDRMDFPKSMMELTLRDRLLIPALVNAHTHLDLTHIGPIAHDPAEGFVKWVDHIRSNRKTVDADIHEAVQLGIQASLAGGSIAVGDIAGSPGGRITDASAHTLAASPLIGVSYLEFFGIGTTAAGAIKKIDHYLSTIYPQSLADLAGSGVQIGLQPHAPNTVDLAVYRWAAAAARARSMPLSTHLAETPEERAFIADGTGPQRTFLERFGIWHDSILDHIAKNNHPVEHLADVLSPPVARLAEPGSSDPQHIQRDPARRAGPPKPPNFLVAHVNDATDAAIETLALTNTAVAYCPRASAYFGADHHFGPHRYRDMLGAGVNVCLGTDSIVNLDTPDRISILDELRLLARRDGTDPKTLLQMATTNGAKALGLDPQRFTLTPGTHPLGLLAIPIEPGHSDSWAGAMQSNERPEWVFIQASEGLLPDATTRPKGAVVPKRCRG